MIVEVLNSFKVTDGTVYIGGTTIEVDIEACTAFTFYRWFGDIDGASFWLVFCYNITKFISLVMLRR